MPDEYGYLTKDDTVAVAKLIDAASPFTFHFSCENGSGFELLVAPVVQCLSPGTRVTPQPRLWLGIVHHGCYAFDLDRKEDIFPTYVAEKMRLPLTDAEPLTALLNGIRAEWNATA